MAPSLTRDLPPRGAKGTYLLVLRLPRRTEVEVGRMGAVSLARGYHLYVGSARGPDSPAGADAAPFRTPLRLSSSVV